MNCIIHRYLFGAGFRPKLDTVLKGFALPFLALVLLSSLSLADIYRCKSDSGVVTYSDEPCGDNAVVAFENYVMGVEEAASRDIILPTTDRKDEYEVINAMTDHAKKVGSCVFRNKELKGVILSKTGRSYSKNDLSYSVNMCFGPEGGPGTWVIKVFYEGRMADGPSVRLKKIKIFKDYKPFDAIGMRNLKTFRKINPGEWEYRR